MATDMIGTITRLLGGQSSSISALLGESEEHTGAGLRAVVPALLAGLVSRGADTRGARGLLEKLGSSTVDPGLAAGLPAMLRNRENFGALLESGQGLLGYLIGGRSGAVSDAVSRVAGIKPSSASALLGMAAPVLFSFLKKQVLDGGLDASGLKSLLTGQTPMLQKMDLDPRITDAMGIPDLQEVLGFHERRTEDSVDDARRSAWPQTQEPERRWIGWLIGVGAAILVAGVLWSLLGRPRDTNISATAAGPQSVYFEPERAVVDGPEWTVIDSVADAVRGSGRSVVLTGSTPRTGDGSYNLALVQQRVGAVKDGLVARGVPEMRIVIQPPVPAADTNERSQRVRIELRPAP